MTGLLVTTEIWRDGYKTTLERRVDTTILDRLTPIERETVDRVVDDLIDESEALGVREPAAAIAALLMEQAHEDQVYARGCERRGVLAL